jgi:hypothetical protein
MYYDGHKIRIVNGYPAIYVDAEHSTVYIHILEMEKYLGRQLSEEEVVHHCDQNRANYSIDNLWCFKTAADHTAFHQGKDVKIDDNGIYYCPDKYHRCVICGKRIDYSAEVCSECYNENRVKRSKCPSKEILQDIIQRCGGNFTQIAKLFDVSDNAVRKWCKKYNIPYHSSDYR